MKKLASKNSRIFFHGFVYGEKKSALFDQCDVLLFPSTWVETFGLVILEAYQHGMPVVGTRVGAIPELVTDGKTGLLIEKGVDSLKDAMKRMANCNLLEAMRDQCCNATKRFEFDRFIEAHEMVYHEIIQRRRA